MLLLMLLWMHPEEKLILIKLNLLLPNVFNIFLFVSRKNNQINQINLDK